MSEGLKVDFAELDRMTNGLTGLNAYALPLVPKVGAISADGDLLASAILSPGTAVAAESAVLTASVQLGVTVASTEALVVITASIVKVYQTAEAALVVAATALAVATVKAIKIGSTLPGDLRKLGGVADRALSTAETSAFLSAIGAIRSGESPIDVARAAADGFWNGAASGLQDGLGALGSEYDAILGRLISDGHMLGLFDDGSPIMGLPNLVAPETIRKRGRSAVAQSEDLTGLELLRDDQSRVVPTDIASMFAGSKQIDAAGAQDVSDIRVITREISPGQFAFTVQIPSTLSWSPQAGNITNDLTSDLYALKYGDTALREASFAALRAAMNKAGAPADSPVMVSGFSLGGITAATMAQDPQGFNIRQVVTAGSPIAGMSIPESTKVVSPEATGDPIASLDGASNPVGANWQTIHQEPSALVGEKTAEAVNSIERHNADRYAMMASSNPAVNADPDVIAFLGDGSDSTVEDYFATRR